MTRAAIIYGLAMAAGIFFIGFTTGMGGALLPNLGFSVLMGVFAAVCYTVVVKYFGGRS